MRFPRKKKKKCKKHCEDKYGCKVTMIKNSSKLFEEGGWMFMIQLQKNDLEVI